MSNLCSYSCALILATSAGLLSSSSALAGSLTPWAPALGQGEVAFTQYGYVSPSGVSGASYLNPGLGNGVDLIAGAGFAYEGGFSAGAVEFIPRWFFHDNVGLAVRAASTDLVGTFEVGPEIHAAFAAGQFAFTTNFGWRPTVGTKMATGGVFGVFAPEFFVTDSFSVWTEVNPSVAFGDKTSVDVVVVPGFAYAAGSHGVSVGVQVPASDPSAWSVGAWYGFAWGGCPSCE